MVNNNIIMVNNNMVNPLEEVLHRIITRIKLNRYKGINKVETSGIISRSMGSLGDILRNHFLREVSLGRIIQDIRYVFGSLS